MNNDKLFIDLNDIAAEDVEILAQEGSRGMADFAASSGTSCCAANACSCTTTTTKQPATTVSTVEQ